MDPRTWKKESLSNHWSGPRGFRKICCKVCCRDKLCGGCRVCLCRQNPVRGLFDGMVVLTCITKDSLPKDASFRLDHEELSILLEYFLTLHFMQADSTPGNTIVKSGREKLRGDRSSKTGEKKRKTAQAYCIYLAFRLIEVFRFSRWCCF